ncbi:MAG: molybdenum cofactor biosynthesis protein MoaE [Planctomycetota bacterium]
MIDLIDTPIDTTPLVDALRSPDAGAVVLFVGITREFTGDRRTLFLEYDAYRPMAKQEMEKLRDAALADWPLCGCAIVHRLGRVEISEASVAVAVSSPHRAEAFAAGEWLMQQLKVKVPIWKKEHWDDGSSEWVHPGNATEPTPHA